MRTARNLTVVNVTTVKICYNLAEGTKRNRDASNEYVCSRPDRCQSCARGWKREGLDSDGSKEAMIAELRKNDIQRSAFCTRMNG